MTRGDFEKLDVKWESDESWAAGMVGKDVDRG